MTYRANYLNLNQKESSPEVIRTVNRCVSHGMPVFRWKGPQTSFASSGDLILPAETLNATLSKAEFLNLPESEARHLAPLKAGRVAFLWDKSFLWGYLAANSLRDLGFSFDLLTAEDVRNRGLDGYQVIVVPGGWASLKSEELGPLGRDELRRYVWGGGGYLGICGGAGLALQVDEGLSLLPVTRKPMAERLPNFSGSILVRPTGSHPLWWGLQGKVSLRVWWPSQFELVDPKSIQILGRYGLPEEDFCVSDLNVCDTETAGLDWKSLERDYQINLDPVRLLDEPAVLEGKYGKGRVVLSYPHLETPGDASGNLALFNIWYDLLDTCGSGDGGDPDRVNLPGVVQVKRVSLDRARRIAREAEELVALGENCGLWSWRSPWLLKWKRGIRGAEFGTICVLLQGLANELARTGGIATDSTTPSYKKIESQFEKLGELWRLFQSKGRALVEEECRSLREQTGNDGKELTPRVRALRTEIFDCVQCYGSSSYGGLYRQLLDHIDTLLLGALLADVNISNKPSTY